MRTLAPVISRFYLEPSGQTSAALFFVYGVFKTMPKKPTEPLPCKVFDDCQHSAETDAWLYKYAASFWDNYVNFRELAKSDGNKFYHSMRDYYGNGVSVVGFLRSQLKSTKGLFNNGDRKTTTSGGGFPYEGITQNHSAENRETD